MPRYRGKEQRLHDALHSKYGAAPACVLERNSEGGIEESPDQRAGLDTAAAARNWSVSVTGTIVDEQNYQVTRAARHVAGHGVGRKAAPPPAIAPSPSGARTPF